MLSMHATLGTMVTLTACPLQVSPGKKVMLLARRDGAQVRFSLRAGTGSPVAVAPWKEEWGGGASVENPHFQRVHYCDLLVKLLLTLFDHVTDKMPSN